MSTEVIFVQPESHELEAPRLMSLLNRRGRKSVILPGNSLCTIRQKDRILPASQESSFTCSADEKKEDSKLSIKPSVLSSSVELRSARQKCAARLHSHVKLSVSNNENGISIVTSHEKVLSASSGGGKGRESVPLCQSRERATTTSSSNSSCLESKITPSAIPVTQSIEKVKQGKSHESVDHLVDTSNHTRAGRRRSATSSVSSCGSSNPPTPRSVKTPLLLQKTTSSHPRNRVGEEEVARAFDEWNVGEQLSQGEADVLILNDPESQKLQKLNGAQLDSGTSSKACYTPSTGDVPLPREKEDGSSIPEDSSHDLELNINNNNTHSLKLADANPFKTIADNTNCNCFPQFSQESLQGLSSMLAYSIASFDTIKSDPILLENYKAKWMDIRQKSAMMVDLCDREMSKTDRNKSKRFPVGGKAIHMHFPPNKACKAPRNF